MMESSFYLTYVLLMTTGTITFIESLRTTKASVRHLMNIETCVSIVGAYFYSIFLSKLKENPVSFKDITNVRYLDWFITTPLMLLALSVVFGMEMKTSVTIGTYALMVVLDFAMLACGYLVEVGKFRRMVGFVVGFVFFALLFGMLYVSFLAGGSATFVAWLSYFIFLGLWSLYGVAFLLEERPKNIVYNFLDLVSKCFVGIFFWMYFTGVVKFRL